MIKIQRYDPSKQTVHYTHDNGLEEWIKFDDPRVKLGRNKSGEYGLLFHGEPIWYYNNLGVQYQKRGNCRYEYYPVQCINEFSNHKFQVEVYDKPLEIYRYYDENNEEIEYKDNYGYRYEKVGQRYYLYLNDSLLHIF